MHINIQAVTACRRDRFFRIILRKLPSPLPPLSKGGGLTAWHKPLLYSVLLAIPPPFYSPNFSAVKTEGLHSVSRIILIGGIYSGFQPQAELGAARCRKKTVTAYHCDRLSANYRFVYSRRFTILQIAQAIPKAELSAATRRTAVSPRLANLKHFQRRNLEWHVAAKKTVTAYHRDRLSANHRFVYSRRFTILQIAQAIPKAEFTVAFSHRRNCQRRLAAGA